MSKRFRDICLKIGLEIFGSKYIGVTTLTFQVHVTWCWALNILGSRPWPFNVTWRHRSRDDSIPHMLFLIGAPLKPSPYLQALASFSTRNISGSRPWPFGVTWRHRACDHFIPPYSISYRCFIVTDSISSRFRDIGSSTYNGHDFHLSRSRYVIGHMTIRFSICSFLLVLHWNQVTISKRFRYIWLQIYPGRDLDLLRSRDVIGHMTIWCPT